MRGHGNRIATGNLKYTKLDTDMFKLRKESTWVYNLSGAEQDKWSLYFLSVKHQKTSQYEQHLYK